jgi:hypothetical protein
MKKPGFITAGAILTILIILFAIWLVVYGGITEAFRLQPTVDSSTPRTQGPFTLIDVERAKSDGAMHFATSPPVAVPMRWWNPQGIIVPGCMSDADDWDFLVKVNGLPLAQKLELMPVSKLPVHVTVETSNHDSEPFTLDYAALSRSNFPAGVLPFKVPPVSPSCRYVAVQVTDKSGHRATWQVNNIPHYRLVAMTPNVKGEHVVVDGVTINTQATLAPDTNMFALETKAAFETVPSSSHTYLISVNPLEYNVDLYPHLKPTLATLVDINTHGDYQWVPGHNNLVVDLGYAPFDARQINACRMSGTIIRQACLDETVTFHNIFIFHNLADPPFDKTNPSSYPVLASSDDSWLAPQTVTTPSGVRVSFVPNQGWPSDETGLIINQRAPIDDIDFDQAIDPSRNNQSLTSFSRRYGKNVEIIYKAVVDGRNLRNAYGLDRCMDRVHTGKYFRLSPKSPYVGYPVKECKFLIRQIIPVSETPFSVTVPVHHIDRIDSPAGRN